MPRQRKNFRVYLEGDTELDRKLQKLRGRAGGRAVREATNAAADVMVAAAKARAPVRTGRLRDSIGKQEGRVQVGRTTVEVGPGKRAWYARLVELGTKRAGPHPFLRPAFDAAKDDALRAARAVLARIVDV